ncbi:MAG: hypothetical protein IKI69_06220 [Oscillospiraceae bacterium]|nr:hypothetical protein [Oscillospiraceae bacterium]
MAFFVFLLINKIFKFTFDEKTIYLLGVVSVVASCAGYGQIVAERKNEGIYEYCIGVGTSIGNLIVIEIIEFYVINGFNFLFVSMSNSLLWFIITGKLDLSFFMLYTLIILLTSIMFGVLSIKSSLLNDNASYHMSFSIFLIMIIVMVFNLINGLVIISIACIVFNAACWLKIKRKFF